MKVTKGSSPVALLATAALTLVLSVCPTWAAVEGNTTTPLTAHPLNQPRGLALDAKGNLYVANEGANQILIYNPSYVQQTAKTVTANISKPTSVAFDPTGNLWVANLGNFSITEYAPTGTQIVAGTFTQGITGPNSLAVDGLGDVWVENSFSTVNVYAADHTPIQSQGPFPFVGGIAVEGQKVAYSNSMSVIRDEAGPWLAGNFVDGLFSSADEGVAVAFDSKGDLYVANADNLITFYNTNMIESVFLTLNFTPEGIAVDSARGRVYISDQIGNAIAVYNTNGTLLTTIH